MTRYIAQRLLAAVATLIGVSLIIFLLVRLTPGDPARVIAGLLATEEDVQRIRVQMGLDQPLAVQYAMFFGRMVQGDLGTSARTKEPVLEEILARLPATMKLAVISMTIAGIMGVVGGVVAAYRRNSKLDLFISVGTLFGVSMPV